MTRERHLQFCDRLFKFHCIGVLQDRAAENMLLKHNSGNNVVTGTRTKAQKSMTVQKVQI